MPPITDATTPIAQLDLVGRDDRLVVWQRRRSRSRDFRAPFEGRWSAYWKYYRNTSRPLTDDADWWRSNEPIPTPFKIVETLMPRYVVSMFSSPDWVKVEARHPEAEEYENLVENLLKTRVQEMHLFENLKEALRYATIMGHCWGKVTWHEEYDYQRRLVNSQIEDYDETTGEVVDSQEAVTDLVEKVELYNGPKFEWVTLDKIFPDPSGRGEWYIEQQETTLDALWDEHESVGDLYDQEQLQALTNWLGTSGRSKGDSGLGHFNDGTQGVGAYYYDHARQPESTEGIPNYQVSPGADGEKVDLWLCWGKVPRHLRPKGRDEEGGKRHPIEAWRLTVIANGRFILRDDAAPTPNGKPPYFPIKSLPIPDRLYGESILNYVGPLADQQSRLANMRIDEVYLGIFQQYMIAQQKVLSDNQNLIMPGGWVQLQLEPGQSVNDVFGVVPRRPVTPDAWNEDQYRQTQAEHTSGATDVMQGVSGSDRTTATESTIKLQQGNARHTLQTMWYEQTVKKEVLTRSWQWDQMRLTQPKLIRMGGRKAAEVDLSMLTIPVDIIVGGGLFEFSKVQRMEMAQQLTTLAGNPAFMSVMKPIPILHRLLEEMGWKNTERFVKSEEEFAQEQEQAKAAQILSASLGEGVGANGEAGPMGQAMAQQGGAPSDTGDMGMSPMPSEGLNAQMVGGMGGTSTSAQPAI